ncbi:YczE/YyaS/YitT family protein [Lentibacillus salinarum]|uniref:YitT family protein n=1 Tax=Lentibacillus salinarum TaxID=446820 RepID=A0ABW3ZVJ9_9BACI
MKQLKRIILLSTLITINGFAVSLTLKAAIGVGAWDALAQSISYLSGIKVGTIGIILNSSCVLGQWILLRKHFSFRHLLQVPVSILLGIVVNVFLYDVFSSIIIDSYAVNLMLLIIGYVIIAGAVGSIMVLDVVTFALEGSCMALAKTTKLKFTVVRQWADILSILFAVLFTFGFSLPPTIREGTIIGMLIFAPLMGFFMKRIRVVFRKLGLIEEVNNIDVDKGSVSVV